MDARRGVRPTFLRAPTEEPAARIGQRTRRGECPRQLRAFTPALLVDCWSRSRRYPNLKSNQNFLALQSQLEDTENRISVARRDYIDSVRAYNTELKTFPGVIWASTLYRSYKPMETFT